MQREVERFAAEEPNGNRHMISCVQEFKKTAGQGWIPESRHFRTAEGVFLKMLDDCTFRILGSGRMLRRRN